MPPAPRLDALDAKIRTRIAEDPDTEVSVVLVDLATGLRMEIDSDVTMHAASTMKVPVMLEAFRQAEAGRLSLDEEISVVFEFRSIVGDTVYTLSADDDSEKTLYARAGERVSVRELVRLMIVRSSNLALNLLIQRVGADAVTRAMEDIGADGMRVLRGVEDGPAFRRGLNNTTTAAGLARVLEAIARCSLTRRTACDEMTEILAAQEFNEMLPAGLPAGMRVAHKTGWITGIQHDGGIVYPATRAPYVLVVLTRGFADRMRAQRVGADISRMVWQQLTDSSFNAWVRPAAPEAAALLALHERWRVGDIGQRHFGHAQLWRAFEPYLGRGVGREVVGRSGEGRTIELLRYGNGPVRVLLWSQMHGDEPTATQALLDLVHYMDASPDARTRNWTEKLTVLMVPMLNPDGAERFRRHNAFGIDVNRDARALATPEARTLKAVRDRYQPQFGFNLHDQNVRTRVGTSDRRAAIALLAPPVDDDATPTEGFVRAQHVAATVRRAIDPLVGGYVTQYDDSFNPRAFGDLMQQWGTSTVLIESGGWHSDPEKQFLRAVNFVAIASALDAIANETYTATPLVAYTSLPGNGRSVNDVLILGGSIVIPGADPVRADIALNLDGDPGRPLGAPIAEVGDIDGVEARDTIDVSGLFLVPLGEAFVAPGLDASFSVRASVQGEEVFRIERGIVRGMR